MDLSEPLGEASPLMTPAEVAIFDKLRAATPLTEADRHQTETTAWVEAMLDASIDLRNAGSMKRPRG